MKRRTTYFLMIFILILLVSSVSIVLGESFSGKMNVKIVGNFLVIENIDKANK